MDSPVIPLLRRARDCADALIDQTLRNLDLTYPQYIVLTAVVRHGTTSLQMVMLHTGCQQRECEHVIRNLHTKGLVYCMSTAQQQRDFTLCCTNRGHEVIAMADNLFAEVDAALMDAIEPSCRETFVDLLSDFVAKFRH